jgi:hypothetical protein
MKTPDGKTVIVARWAEFYLHAGLKAKRAIEELSQAEAERDRLDLALTNKNETIAEQEKRIEALETENLQLREALRAIADIDHKQAHVTVAGYRYAALSIISATLSPKQETESRCGLCGDTGEICYSSTSYGPCPECHTQNAARSTT